MPRIFRLRLIARGSASAGSMVTTWLESIKAAATYYTVLSGFFAARWRPANVWGVMPACLTIS